MMPLNIKRKVLIKQEALDHIVHLRNTSAQTYDYNERKSTFNLQKIESPSPKDALILCQV